MAGPLITIAQFASPFEAGLARALLESHAVYAFLADENVSRIANHLAPMIGGAKLQVRREDEARARAILAREPDSLQP